MENKESNIYPVGAYVVLLTVGKNKGKMPLNQSFIPTDYVYKLRQAHNGEGIYLDKDTKGSRSNGYSTSNLELRAATQDEIAEYEKNDAPCPAIEIVVSQIINEYPIY